MRDMRVLHLTTGSEGGNKARTMSGGGVDTLDLSRGKGKMDVRVSEVALCLGAEGVLESFNGRDGVLDSVIEPSVARHLAAVADAGLCVRVWLFCFIHGSFASYMALYTPSALSRPSRMPVCV